MKKCNIQVDETLKRSKGSLEQPTISEIVFKRDGLLEVGFESQICFDSSFLFVLGWILLNFEDDDEHSVRLSSLSKDVWNCDSSGDLKCFSFRNISK